MNFTGGEFRFTKKETDEMKRKMLQNLHTHTSYCDGKDSPETMVKYAIEKGFDSLGFSGHSYMSYSPYSKVTPESTQEYKKEINLLKKQYEDQLSIYLGLEVDMYSGVELSGYDYLIGSVHYMKIGDAYFGFDRMAKGVQELICEQFGGDGMKFAKKYYEEVAMLPRYGDFDIIGHFDLITKNLDTIAFFDEQSKEYLGWALEAMQALKGKIPFFEVNTGAIARGYRKTPYPSITLLKEFKRQGFGAIVTSDCHDGRLLDCGLEDAENLLRHCGFKEKYILTKEGFKAVAL